MAQETVSMCEPQRPFVLLSARRVRATQIQLCQESEVGARGEAVKTTRNVRRKVVRRGPKNGMREEEAAEQAKITFPSLFLSLYNPIPSLFFLHIAFLPAPL